MTVPKICSSNRVVSCVGKKVTHPADLARYAVEKSTTVLKPKPKTNLLKCKRNLHISTFNTRTLTSSYQIGELTAAVTLHNQDIIGVQEHRHFHNDVRLKHHDTGNGWTLVTSSAYKNTANASIGGIGILMSPKAQKALNNIESITPCILVASFNGNPKTTVVCCYSPTNIAEEDEVERFYDELSSLIRQIPHHNITMILGGDFNAKLGQNYGFKHSFHKGTIRNGLLLHDFMNENKMVCLNIKYKKRTRKKWTFTYPNGVRSQIDFILINKMWVSRTKNVNLSTHLIQ